MTLTTRMCREQSTGCVCGHLEDSGSWFFAPCCVCAPFGGGCEFIASLAAVMASEMIANIWRAGVDFRSSSLAPVSAPLVGAVGRDVLMM